MKFSMVATMVFLSQLLLVSGSISLAKFSPFDSPDFCSQIITPTCNTTFSYIDRLNEQIRPYLTSLVETPYFRYFKLNFDKQCKFWDTQHFCATENCAVEILPPSQYNWSNISNDNLKPSKLGQIKRPESTGLADDSASGAETCEDFDYCHIDDDHQCVYVNLLDNPERFTGYGGSQSYDVWKAIYSENCFPNTNPMSMKDVNAEPEQCVEKKLFYRLISGMHASIAVHLSNEYLSPGSGNFEPNLKVFMERVGSFNDRLSNIYFNFALISESIVKLSNFPKLLDTIDHGDDFNQHFLSNSDQNYKQLLSNIVPELSSNLLYNSSTLFNPEVVSPTLKDEFRARFKNVSAIMDCVGCDRCRMWGKLQTIGYGTAFKILFEGDNIDKLKFRRIELVALFNTFDRLSKSIEAINNFKQMYLAHLEDVKKGLVKPGDYEKAVAKENGGLDFPFLLSVNFGQDTDKSTKEKTSNSEDLKPAGTSAAKKQPMTFKEEFNKALLEVIDAFFFVITSYKRLPKTIYNISLFKLNHWWNIFIGREEYNQYMEYQLLQNKEQNDYINLFSN